MKVYETSKNIIISIPKEEVRFSSIYGDQKGFYVRFLEVLGLDEVVTIERALPVRTPGDSW